MADSQYAGLPATSAHGRVGGIRAVLLKRLPTAGHRESSLGHSSRKWGTPPPDVRSATDATQYNAQIHRQRLARSHRSRVCRHP